VLFFFSLLFPLPACGSSVVPLPGCHWPRLFFGDSALFLASSFLIPPYFFPRNSSRNPYFMAPLGVFLYPLVTVSPVDYIGALSHLPPPDIKSSFSLRKMKNKEPLIWLVRNTFLPGRFNILGTPPPPFQSFLLGHGVGSMIFGMVSAFLAVPSTLQQREGLSFTPHPFAAFSEFFLSGLLCKACLPVSPPFPLAEEE